MVMHGSAVSRRRFLVAAIAFSSSAIGLRLGKAWAQDRLSNDDRAALARFARRLYPHAAIADDVYAEVVEGALARAATDPALAGALDEAGTALDAEARRIGGGDSTFIDLGTDEQVETITSIEEQPFFAAVQGAVLVGVYNHPAVWALVGYGGPSFEQGGYLNRGAGEIDWLDEGAG
jgi:hypothetical protein